MSLGRGQRRSKNMERVAVQRAPLAAHPAFAPILALWFAALCGLAVMVLPMQILEPAVAASGIEKYVSAAAAPLGNTAQFILAGMATVAGAVLGFLFARTLARFSNRPLRTAQPAPDAATGTPTENYVADEPFPFDADRFVDNIEADYEPLEDRGPSVLDVEAIDEYVSELSSQAGDPSAIDEYPELYADDYGVSEETSDTENYRSDDSNFGAAPRDPDWNDEPTDGLGVLRQRPIEKLSLAEMLERFGGALAERREEIARDPKLRSQAGPIIADALRALSEGNSRPQQRMITSHGNAAIDVATREQVDQTEAALRDALEKLQRMSGNY